MRKPRRGLSLPASRTWFLALVFAVAAFAVLHGPDSPGGGPGHPTPAFWPTSSKAYAAATDYFLNVDGIPGDSTAAGYAGQIVVNSWQFGVGRTLVTGNPASAAKVNCADFVFAKILDVSSPGLLRESLGGSAISKVVLSGTRTATPDQVLFLRITFTNVLESSYAMSSGGDTPTESVSFNYGTLLVEYRAQNTDGSFAPPVSSSFDCLHQVSTGGGGAPTTTTVAATGSPTYGSPVTLVASVTAGAGTPTGTVAFSAGATMLCPAATVSAGAATCRTSALVVGTNPITAAYTPDSSAFTASSGSTTITLAPAPLTVTTNSATRVYGTANPGFTVSFSGFVNGEGPSSLGGTLSFATAAGATSGVGSYDVTPGGLSSTNYAISFVAGTLSVTPAALTVTTDAASKAYGTANPSFTASYSGFVNGNDPTVLGGTLGFTTTATATSPVGTYAVTPGGLTSTNYLITFAAGNLTVTPALLTVTANDASKVYGQPNPVFSASFSGFVNGDGPPALSGTLTFATAATAASLVGAYPVIPAGLSSGNYSISFAAGTLSVTPAPLTVTAIDTTKIYGQAHPAFTAGYHGFANGDGPASLGGTLSFTTLATASSPVGTYGVTPGGLNSTNYTVTFLVGTLTVTPAPLTVTAVNSGKVYGSDNPAFTTSYSGFVNGDSPGSLRGVLTFLTAAGSGSPAGSYAVTPGGLSSPNYAITFVAGTLSVTPAPLTVTTAASSKVYGQPNPVFSANYSGFVNGDGPASLGGALVFSTAAAAASAVGSYPVTPSGLTSANYAITFVAGTLAVTPAPLTITADHKTRAFGVANPPFSATYAGFVNGDGPASLSGVLAFACPATAASPVGVYPITVSGLTAVNYVITYQAGALLVTPAVVTLTLAVDLSGFEDDNVVQLRVTVSPSDVSGSEATGTVRFYLDGRPLGPARVLRPRDGANRSARIEGEEGASLTHTFRVVFVSTNPNFTSADQTLTFSLPPEEGERHVNRGGES